MSELLGSVTPANDGRDSRVATAPPGASDGGKIWRLLCSASMLEISDSIWDRNSLEALRNSFIILPSWRAISGNFLGPKTSKAKTKRKIVSPKLITFMILPEGVSGNAASQTTDIDDRLITYEVLGSILAR